MKRFIVYAVQEVQLEFIVEADSQREAEMLAYDKNILPVDSYVQSRTVKTSVELQ